jgi:hypothetical protein
MKPPPPDTLAYVLKTVQGLVGQHVDVGAACYTSRDC